MLVVLAAVPGLEVAALLIAVVLAEQVQDILAHVGLVQIFEVHSDEAHHVREDRDVGSPGADRILRHQLDSGPKIQLSGRIGSRAITG